MKPTTFTATVRFPEVVYEIVNACCREHGGNIPAAVDAAYDCIIDRDDLPMDAILNESLRRAIRQLVHDYRSDQNENLRESADFTPAEPRVKPGDGEALGRAVQRALDYYGYSVNNHRIGDMTLEDLEATRATLQNQITGHTRNLQLVSSLIDVVSQRSGKNGRNGKAKTVAKMLTNKEVGELIRQAGITSE